MQASEKEQWSADKELAGFDVLALSTGQAPAYRATLVRACDNPVKAKGTIVYLHGMTDYFFQAHLAHALVEAGFAFYALDLHGYGRSLNGDTHPNYCSRVDEYFAEIDLALKTIKSETTGPLVVNAHSTGGLIASLYAHRGAERKLIDGLCLNSPFFEFPAHGVELFGIKVLAWLGRWLPYLSYSRKTPSLYAQSIHQSFRGQWQYNTTIKPAEGFPLYLGWIRAIVIAQRELQAGLAIECPVLVMHSSRSIRGLGQWQDDMLSTDAVLDVEDMRRYGPGLGAKVSMVEVEGGMHDLMLSTESVRRDTLSQMYTWLGQIIASVE
ncbi:alpha/beta hydrolase [Gilvimarinus agarilyticus]|uniref:alpha/beta hydrolase n=1 Tax=Gilvimarinus sp. 2_MG-2023 TaxID=3062666 RepID=UPI001C082C98|nr:alpha/beta hydrolase [Gilvimarinus sp. 2_MG-2023]MBU2886346.1 alpha/beta hydrolase [Gilvimarinus agarilyticus]MDO6571032.1 alpha/beta hydrolase [Gilvimarinus sp. 2_MG-2023]